MRVYEEGKGIDGRVPVLRVLGWSFVDMFLERVEWQRQDQLQ
jgi:hypothetical protein